MVKATDLQIAIDKIKEIQDAQKKKVELSKRARMTQNLKELRLILASFEETNRAYKEEVDWVCFAPLSF